MAKSIPLGALLPGKLDSVADQVRERMCDDEEIGRMKLAWGFIGKELHKALMSALDCDLLEVIGQTGPVSASSPPSPTPPRTRLASARWSSSVSTTCSASSTRSSP